MPLSATAAVILGAGSGTRAKQHLNKVYLELEGRPVIVRAASPFARHSSIDHVVVVAAEHEIDLCTRIFDRAGTKVAVIAGGETRHASEAGALEYLAPMIESGEIAVVVIHDGARPLFDAATLDDLLDSARRSGGAIYGLPLENDLIRLEERNAKQFIDRTGLWRAQTPQAFQAQLLLSAYRAAAESGFEGTDTAASVERIGGTVEILQGDERNVKITFPDDLMLAESLIKGEKTGAGGNGAD